MEVNIDKWIFQIILCAIWTKDKKEKTLAEYVVWLLCFTINNMKKVYLQLQFLSKSIKISSCLDSICQIQLYDIVHDLSTNKKIFTEKIFFLIIVCKSWTMYFCIKSKSVYLCTWKRHLNYYLAYPEAICNIA